MENLVENAESIRHSNLTWPTPWRLCLAEQLCVRGADQLYMEFSTRRSALLLVRLALSPKRTFTRASLCQLLWPDDQAEATRSLLRNELARLKRALGQADELFRADRSTVRFNTDIATTDLAEMLAALNRATRAEDTKTRLAQFELATSIDCSNILPEFEDTWIERERERYKNYARLAHIGLAKAQMESGETEAALRSFELAIEILPSHEEAYIAAMTALGQLSRHAEAMALFQRLEEQLRLEHSMSPSVNARNAFDRCMRASAAVVPDLASLHGPSNIPMALTPIVGRSEEIEKVCSLLSPTSETRLITLLGPGGMGKTRVSIEVANRLREVYADKVWFVELVDNADPADISGAVLSAMRIETQGTIDASRILQANLPRTPSLIVLDNFEQLLDGGAAVVAKLLSFNSELRLLVTSRQRLNLGGEREFPIPPLGVKDAGSDGVKLFLQIAQAAQPRLAVDESTLELAREIVSKLEGIPLAIHLAAARCDVLSLPDLLRQLDKRFNILVSKRTDLSKRHLTLRNTVEWSFRLMSPELQSFFVELSVFRDGWTLESAAAVLGRQDTIELIDGLRARSFIVAELGPHGMRFRMLETLREFAAERMPPARLDEIRERHSGYFIRLVLQAHSHFAEPDQVEWLDRVELDHENVVAGLDWAADRQPADALTSLVKLLRFWQIRSYHGEARKWIARILVPPFPPTKECGDALFGASQIYHEQFDLVEALRWYEHALQVYSQAGRPLDRCAILQNMACLYNDQSDYSRALELAKESYDYQLTVPHILGSSFALDEIARAKLGRGDLDGAIEDAKRTLEIRLTGRDSISPAEAEIWVGEIHLHRGEIKEAAQVFESALSTFRRINRVRLVALIHCYLAEIDFDLGQVDEASHKIQFAEEACGVAGFDDVRIVASLLKTKLLLRRGGRAEAMSLAQQTLSQAMQQGVASRTLTCIEMVAAILLDSGDAETSAKLLLPSDRIRLEMDRPRLPRQQAERRDMDERLIAELRPEKYRALEQEAESLPLEELALLALQNGRT